MHVYEIQIVPKIINCSSRSNAHVLNFKSEIKLDRRVGRDSLMIVVWNHCSFRSLSVPRQRSTKQRMRNESQVRSTGVSPLFTTRVSKITGLPLSSRSDVIHAATQEKNILTMPPFTNNEKRTFVSFMKGVLFLFIKFNAHLL